MKFDTIQLWRGLAALYVFLFHTDHHWQIDHGSFIGKMIHNGYTGVDIFFVISGFVITLSLKKYTGVKGFVQFILGRFIRIYPTYWIIAAAFLFFGICSEQYTSTYLAKSFFLLPGYVLRCTVPSWTLTHELYFYLLTAGNILTKTFKLLLIALVFIGILLLLQTAELFSLNIPARAFWSIYYLEFCSGILIQFLYQRMNVKIATISIITGLLLHLALVGKGVPGNWYLFAISIPAFLIILGSCAFENIRKPKIPSLFVWLGNASYILYLINFGLCIFLPKIIKMSNIPANLTILLFIGVVSACALGLHTFMEKPLQRYLNKLILAR